LGVHPLPQKCGVGLRRWKYQRRLSSLRFSKIFLHKNALLTFIIMSTFRILGSGI